MWSIGLITFAFGLAAGYAIHFFLNPGDSRAKALEQELERLRGESEAYRNQVVEHFQRTSELVQDMTRSYRAVYEHLASSSQQLCNEPVSTPQLDLPERGQLPGTHPAPETPSDDARASRPGSGKVAQPLHDTEEEDEYLGDAPYVPDLDLQDQAESGEQPAKKPSGGSA